MPVLHTIIFVCWAVFWISWIAWAFRSKKNIRSRLGGFMRARLLLFVVLVIVVHLHFRQAYGLNLQRTVSGNKAVLTIGFIIFLLGLALAIWARVYLGKNWGMPMAEKQEPELVTSGPYRFIRHPIYTGILLAILGSALAISLYWLVILAFSGTYFIYSATVEERNMMNQFPKTYPGYKRRTKMLIPFVL